MLELRAKVARSKYSGERFSLIYFRHIYLQQRSHARPTDDEHEKYQNARKSAIRVFTLLQLFRCQVEGNFVA